MLLIECKKFNHKIMQVRILNFNKIQILNWKFCEKFFLPYSSCLVLLKFHVKIKDYGDSDFKK